MTLTRSDSGAQTANREAVHTVDGLFMCPKEPMRSKVIPATERLQVRVRELRAEGVGVEAFDHLSVDPPSDTVRAREGFVRAAPLEQIAVLQAPHRFARFNDFGLVDSGEERANDDAAISQWVSSQHPERIVEATLQETRFVGRIDFGTALHNLNMLSK